MCELPFFEHLSENEIWYLKLAAISIAGMSEFHGLIKIIFNFLF